MIHNVNGNMTDDSYLLQYFLTIFISHAIHSRYPIISFHLTSSSAIFISLLTYLFLCLFSLLSFTSYSIFLFISLSRPSIIPYHFRLLLMFFQICHSVVSSSFLLIFVLQPSSPFFLLV